MKRILIIIMFSVFILALAFGEASAACWGRNSSINVTITGDDGKCTGDVTKWISGDGNNTRTAGNGGALSVPIGYCSEGGHLYAYAYCDEYRYRFNGWSLGPGDHNMGPCSFEDWDPYGWRGSCYVEIYEDSTYDMNVSYKERAKYTVRQTFDSGTADYDSFTSDWIDVGATITSTPTSFPNYTCVGYEIQSGGTTTPSTSCETTSFELHSDVTNPNRIIWKYKLSHNLTTSVDGGPTAAAALVAPFTDASTHLTIDGPIEAKAKKIIVTGSDRYCLKSMSGTGDADSQPIDCDSAGSTYSYPFTLSQTTTIAWHYELQKKVTVSIDPTTPVKVQQTAAPTLTIAGQAGVLSGTGDFWVPGNASVTAGVTLSVTDPDTNNVYNCTGFSSTLGDFGSGITNSVTKTIANQSNIVWKYGLVFLINIDAQGLSNTMRSTVANDPSAIGFTAKKNGTPYGAWSTIGWPVNTQAQLSAPNVIYGEPGEPGVRYVLTGWFGTGSVPASGNPDATPGVGFTTTSPFSLGGNSTITWVYRKEMRLKIQTYGASTPLTVYETTGNLTKGSAMISSISTTGLVAGMPVYGNGVPAGTSILSVGSSWIWLDSAVFLTATGRNLTFKPRVTDALADPRECSTTTDPETCEQKADAIPPAPGADISGVNYYPENTRVYLVANYSINDGSPKTLASKDFRDGTTPPADWFEQLINNRKVVSLTLTAPLSIQWRYDSAEIWKVGSPIDCPDYFKTGSPSVCDQIDFSVAPTITILAGNPAQEPVENFFYWSTADQRYFPTRELTSATISWKKTDNSRTAAVNGKSEWPSTRQKHIAGVPANLKAEANGYTFIGVKYPVTGLTVVNGVFNNTVPGISVLLFAKGNTPDTVSNRASFVVVQTEDIALSMTDDATCIVGDDLDGTSYGHVDPEGKNGYIFHSLASYDGDGPDKAYDRETRIGNIVPVNETTSAGAPGNEAPLIVAWYSTAKDPDSGEFLQPVIGWPVKAVRYTCKWPATPGNIVIASGLGSGGLGYLSSNLLIYNQPDQSKPGFNPNEEHALLIANVAYALRNDLNAAFGNVSKPYVLVKYKAFDGSGWHMKVFKVEDRGTAYDGKYYNFTRSVKVGQPILPISPLAVMQPILTNYNKIAQGKGEKWYHKDHQGNHWAKAANWTDGVEPGEGIIKSEISMLWYYPMISGFYLPGASPGDPIPFMNGRSAADIPQQIVYQTYWPADTDGDLGRLKIGDTLTTAKNNCPDLTNQLAVKVIFDEGMYDDKGPLVKLLSPYSEHSIYYGSAGDRLPDPNDSNIKTENNNGLITFPDLPYYLRSRLYYNPASNKLVFKGTYIDYALGDPLVLMNVMGSKEREEIKELSKNNTKWTNAIDLLYMTSRNPNGLIFLPNGHYQNPYNPDIVYSEWFSKWGELLTGLTMDGNLNPQPQTVLISPMALTAGLAQSEGHITIALSDDPSLGAAPVTLKVIKVELPVNSGDIKVIDSDNIFDEKLTLRHSADFAGEPEKFVFSWCYQADNYGVPPDLPTDTDMKGWTCPTDTDWRDVGLQQITIGGAGPFTLSDNWFIMRYYYKDAYPLPISTDPVCTGIPGPYCDASGLPAGCSQCNGTSDPSDQNNWSPWAGGPGGGAQLAEGWIKRVFDKLNPFDARVQDFHNNETNTYVSMISQIGGPCEGDIALNGSAANLNNIGLLEAYCTVLGRGKTFSIDAGYDYGPANNALINAASRIADFYMLLGNEAYADAMDPTIGFTTKSDQFGTAAPTIFAFENQLDSLLDEELDLLRGRDDSLGISSVRAKPVSNRLIWNFTNGEGEVAYKMVYGITDQNHDGLINENDAKLMYPQGHGDAWGYYLSAINTYYRLLEKPYFNWQTRGEAILVGGAPVTIDYFDERKFARIAAQKAKAGGDIIDLTYRKSYVDDAAGQWQGYKDTDTERAWGMDEWARRTAQGTYFDWVMANALLPSVDPNPNHSGITKIDRTTVKELDMIASEFGALQIKADKADKGLNPLGLAKGVVPFDIDPALIDQNVTHFEQIYNRADKALGNAITVFDYANQYSQMLRFNQDKLDDFTKNIRNQELDFKNRLIEIFGYPYSDDIGDGSGKTYAAGYDGPDWIHYMYVDTPQLTGDKATQKIMQYTTTFKFEDEDFDKSGLGLHSSEQDVTFEIPEDMSWMRKPESWIGSRRAPGKLQTILSEVIKAQASFNTGVEEYQATLDAIDRAATDLQALYDIKRDKITVKDNLSIGITTLTAAQAAFQVTADAFGSLREGFEKVCTFQMAGLPSIAGPFVLDPSAPARTGIAIARKIGDTAMMVFQYGAMAAAAGAGAGADYLQGKIDDTFFYDDNRLEVQQRLGDLAATYDQARIKKANLFVLMETINQKLGDYSAALAEGQRLMNQREEFRKNTAGDIQDYRYQDMAFRIFRNDALQKYRASFDLASIYVYLAATAYDYETNLLGSDTNSGRTFLTDIIKERSLGVTVNGLPLSGRPGLTDPMARMSDNFSIYKTQMGFNNPQTETNYFSLRYELFRILQDSSSDENWRTNLGAFKTADLRSLDEFNRYCRPFAPDSVGPQPGIVIPFSTEIIFGQNFFGNPLSGSDSAYDPSHFATKVRSAGVWFTGYDDSMLSRTPRVYLVPVGSDILRSPSGDGFTTRVWQVVDQKIPAPNLIGASDLSNANWIPTNNSLSEDFGGIRRIASLRAYPDTGALNTSQMNTDSRLIGRSVWNTKWMLIIPGGTLLNDPDAGLDTFINTVKDIKLFFQTYSYSGN